MPVSNLRKALGAQGEQLVAKYLEKEGFCILARNYAHRRGEVDLIAELGQLLIFVEVKARMHSYFDLTEVINPVKQKRIITAAKGFILEHACYDRVYRFDVALIEHVESGVISYISNAFTEQEY